MIIEYEAVDNAGKSISDTIEAPDVRAAVEMLRKKNLFVTHAGNSSENSKAKPRKKSSDASQNGTKPLSRVRLSGKQLTMFTRQMSMMLTSGSGIVPALNTVSRQFVKEEHSQLMRALCNDMEEGVPFADALRKYPRIFDSSYCAVVAAGEASGTLNEMIARLSVLVGKRRAMRNKVLGALIYPALLTTLSTAITGVLVFFVLPRFGDMFDTLGVDLPASTAMLLEVSAMAKANLYATIFSGLASFGGAVYLIKSDKGRTLGAAILTRLPIVKRLVYGMILGETFRILGMLIEARVGVLDAIDLVKGVTREKKFQNLYAAMETEVTSGSDISRALENSGIVPPYITHAVGTGEKSGNLGGSMSYVADILDEDNTELLNTLTKLIEPIILIVMGFVVGTVAISLFLPMFDVTAAAQ